MDRSKCCYFLVSYFLIIILLLLRCSNSRFQALAKAEGSSSLQLMKPDSLEWPMAASLYGGDLADDDQDGLEGGGPVSTRRSLFWHRVMRYYISYGALAANRIPCPPRSGRSYYTHNCHYATGPVHPYNRGCSAITRCRR